MSRILVIKSSARGAQSASSALADHFISAYRAQHVNAHVEELDVGSHPLPVLTGETLGAFFTPSEHQSPEQSAANEQSLALIAQLKAADVVVIAYGLYNFGVPTALRTYIDQVARAGLTFTYTENGPAGLVTGKKLVLLAATGGAYTQGPAAAMDHGTPYLRTVLGFLGLTDVSVVTAEGLAMAQDGGAAVLDAAKSEASAIAAQL